MLAILLSTVAFSQSPESPTEPIQYAKETIIDMGEREIDGQIIRPEGSIIIERQAARPDSLIQLRMSFELEMIQSVHEIK